MTISYALVGEDDLCLALGEAIIKQLNIEAVPEVRLRTDGFGKFKAKIESMNSVALNVMPTLMIADGDQADCVVTQIKNWRPAKKSPRLEIRLAVREAEAWVLADSASFARFASIKPGKIPRNPEDLPDPKGTLLGLIKASKRRELRNEMLPEAGSISKTGLGYNLHMVEFVRQHWQMADALDRAPSLARAIPRIQNLLGQK